MDYRAALIGEHRHGTTSLWLKVVVPVTSLCPCSKSDLNFRLWPLHSAEAVGNERRDHLQHIQPLPWQVLLLQARIFEQRVDHMGEAQRRTADDIDVVAGFGIAPFEESFFEQ